MEQNARMQSVECQELHSTTSFDGASSSGESLEADSSCWRLVDDLSKELKNGQWPFWPTSSDSNTSCTRFEAHLRLITRAKFEASYYP
ncbi:hypothetical protein C2S53_018752 [Perilla frutescens var. hirtella]|uniref:Uncharacterized protein n=1 Tax=Perilla frutescens var. hirtella TaxID=608512 RepID=A0AAD4J1X6_PERFH|nr:hypothetical protein C2S53_018752 [Perilla frutescens var. hirtella]